MNVQEIIEDADLLVPNGFPISRKIRWMNQVQKQMYKEMPTSFYSVPPDIPEQMTYIPRFSAEYHELFSLGVAKRMAERNQDFKLADELEVRFQNLLREAKSNLAVLKKVKITRSWM